MSAYAHRIAKLGPDDYRLFWTVDHKYATSRLRFPRSHSRDTDTAGARRFAKRHGVTMPEDREAQP